MKEIKNTNDWLKGFYAGRQSVIDEMMQISQPHLEAINSSVKSIDKTGKDIRQKLEFIFAKLF